MQQLQSCVDALERLDPHFKYAISHSPVPPATATYGALILTTVQFGDRFYSQETFEKYRGASDDAADRLTGSLAISGSEALDALDNLNAYGSFEPVLLHADNIEHFGCLLYTSPSPRDS